MNDLPDLPNIEGWLQVNGISLGLFIFIFAVLLILVGIVTIKMVAAAGAVLVGASLAVFFITAILRID